LAPHRTCVPASVCLSSVSFLTATVAERRRLLTRDGAARSCGGRPAFGDRAGRAGVRFLDIFLAML
jgi:hypothetical protein